MAIKSAHSWLDFLVLRPGHYYWNSRTLDANDFSYSFLSKTFPKKRQEPVTLADSDQVIGASAFLSEYASCTPTTGRTLTTDTAANLISNLGFTVDNDSFEALFNNLAAATHALTIAAGSGVTLIGNATIAAKSSSKIRLRRASATTVTAYIL